MIRQATLLDVPELIEIGRAFHAESPHFRDVPLSPKKVQLMTMISIANESAWIDVTTEDVIAGGLLCVPNPAWFTDENFLVDLALYVRPAYRKSTIGARLARKAIKFAKANGYRRVRFGVSTGIEDDVVGGLYRALGLTECAKCYEVIL